VPSPSSRADNPIELVNVGCEGLKIGRFAKSGLSIHASDRIVIEPPRSSAAPTAGKGRCGPESGPLDPQP